MKIISSFHKDIKKKKYVYTNFDKIALQIVKIELITKKFKLSTFDGGLILYRNLLIRCGFGLKNSIKIHKVFSLFFFFLKSKLNFLKNYKYLNEFYYFFQISKNYFNVNYLLSWLSFWVQPIFDAYCLLVSSRFRKKLKKKYIYKIQYLKKSKRNKKVFSWIVKYSNKTSYYSAIDRNLWVLMDLFLNYKNSYLYNRKLMVYTRIFNSQKSIKTE